MPVHAKGWTGYGQNLTATRAKNASFAANLDTIMIFHKFRQPCPKSVNISCISCDRLGNQVHTIFFSKVIFKDTNNTFNMGYYSILDFVVL